jgi:hypothetical protein
VASDAAVFYVNHVNHMSHMAQVSDMMSLSDWRSTTGAQTQTGGGDAKFALTPPHVSN